MINKQLNIRISPQLFEAIRETGANQNLSPSNYAIAALQYCVDNEISFLPGNVASARNATTIDIVGTVNEILKEFRAELRLELDSRLAEIQSKLIDVSIGNEPDGDNNIPINEDIGDAASDNQDDDRRLIEIIRTNRQSDPPKPFQQIADILFEEKLNVPGKTGRNKPSRVNVAAIAKANGIP
jgi:hypothetical protein